MVLGNENNGKWDVKIYHNPLVNFIWFGVILMIFSGLIRNTKKMNKFILSIPIILVVVN